MQANIWRSSPPTHFYWGSGYFSAPLDTSLAPWSLAIEEQFYIVFPLILLLALRWGGRHWIGVVLALFVLSLAASLRITPVDPDAAFYLAPCCAKPWPSSASH